ncbi:hypothetical protein C8R46DRAFT_1208253 [Mycena filopes]|nr:hypothetical protein C8R46DRAFT_1208253 [Mycena filopes]
MGRFAPLNPIVSTAVEIIALMPLPAQRANPKPSPFVNVQSNSRRTSTHHPPFLLPHWLTLVQINSWKSRHPLEVLTVEDFDIICVQEPNHNEVVNARENSEYVHIYPDAYDNHRVSVFIKLVSIPAANICPRPDLSKSGDILVIEFTFDTHKVTLINLYNDCNTRAGVGLLRFLVTFSGLYKDHKESVKSLMPSWDLLTKTPTCEEDFELHDLLVSRGLLLVTPPDVPTHISGNVIDLGFCSPSLFMAVSATVDPHQENPNLTFVGNN